MARRRRWRLERRGRRADPSRGRGPPWLCLACDLCFLSELRSFPPRRADWRRMRGSFARVTLELEQKPCASSAFAAYTASRIDTDHHEAAHRSRSIGARLCHRWRYARSVRIRHLATRR